MRRWTEAGARGALADADEARAREAFEALARAARPWMESLLRARWQVASADDRADLVQQALTRLWEARLRFVDQGPSAWNGMVRTTLWRVYVDWLRERGKLLVGSEADAEKVPDRERPVVEQALALREAGELEHLADCLFLELDATLPRRLHLRRLLAAQLFYLDGAPWPRVLRLLGPPPPGEPPLTRERLDAWLTDPAVLRHLACSRLYLENAALVAHLLAAGAFSEAQAQAVRWRYGQGMLLESLLARQDCLLDRDGLARLGERCEALFPFGPWMTQLCAAMEAGGAALPADGLTGLWQRLAFAYAYRDELAHRDIQARTRPAARVVGKDVTDAMLNVWLSNRRLLTRLARFVAAQAGEEVQG